MKFKNRVVVNGQIIGLRTGKRYTHAIVAVDKSGLGVYAWSGSYELAVKAKAALEKQYTGLNEIQIAGCGPDGVPGNFRIVPVETE